MFKSRDLMIEVLGARNFACGQATRDTDDETQECGQATRNDGGGDTGIAETDFDALRHQLRQTLGL
jgi:hypothetical protein